MVLASLSARSAPSRGVWGHGPPKFWNFGHSKMVSDAPFATKAPANCNTVITGGCCAQSFSRRENTRSTIAV